MKSLLQRLAQMAVILACLSFVLFGLLSAMPGDPVDMLITSNPRVKPEDVIRLKKLRGLDKPWHVRYFRWIWGYHDPRRPPGFSGVSADAVRLGADGTVLCSFDLLRALSDDGESLEFGAFLGEIEKWDKKTAGDVQMKMEQIFVKEENRVAKAAEVLAMLSPEGYRDVRARIHEKKINNLTLEGLFGAKIQGTRIAKEFHEPGVHPMWFLIRDPDGLEAIGRVSALVAPSSGNPNDPGAQSGQGREEPTDIDRPPDAQRRAAALDPSIKEGSPIGLQSGSVPGQVQEEPNKQELARQARGSPPFLTVGKIPAQVVDKPDAFLVRLKDHIHGIDDAAKENLRFRLSDGMPGEIDAQGVYRHIFARPGQTAILFDIEDASGNKAQGAFSVEHGPIPDPNAFHRGFVFALVGDREALGFSNTYKRPVWDILAGEEVICGDLLVGPGETCDDGNRIDGDGCSESCHNETLSFWQRLDANLAGKLLRSGRVMNTIFLMLPAILLSLLIAIPIGVLSAYRQYSLLDYLVNFFAFVGISLPVFWFGIMVLALFSEQLHILPAGGIQTPGVQGGFFTILADRLRYAFLPAMVLSIAYTGRWLRYMRSSMLEVLPLDFIRTARAKGLPEKIVILKHALRNALIPVVTVLALSVPTLFGGALLTETVFSWPGIGRLQFDAVMSNDYYVAIVVFLISAMLVMVGNLFADFLYVIVDPRIRKGD